MKTKMKVRSYCVEVVLLRIFNFVHFVKICGFLVLCDIFVPLRSVKLCCNIDVPLWVMTKLYQKTPPKTGIKETLACYHLFFPFLQQYTSCDSLGNISVLASGVKQYLSCIWFLSPVPTGCFPWNRCKMWEVLASCDNGTSLYLFWVGIACLAGAWKGAKVIGS